MFTTILMGVLLLMILACSVMALRRSDPEERDVPAEEIHIP